MNAVTHARPRACEVAVIHRPDGAPVTVHTATGPRLVQPQAEGEALIAAVPGDAERLGFGAPLLRYSRLGAVRNGRHPDDRAVWEQAVKAVAGGGAAYVVCEHVDYHGRARWQARHVRLHADNPGYQVAFERIARNQEVPDLVTGPFEAGPPATLAARLTREIGRHARRHGLGARYARVEFDADAMRGELVIGGVRSAGAFAVTETGTDLPGRSLAATA